MPVFAWTATLLAAANFAAACREYTALRPSSIVMGGSNTLQTKAAKPVPRLTLSLGVARQCRLAAWLKTIEAVANLFWALQCCSKTLWVCSPIGWRTFNLGSHPGQLQTGGRSSSDGEPTFTSLSITRTGQLVSSALAHSSTEPAFMLSHHLNFGRCEPGSGKTAPRR